jgi:hypothetical protein
MRANDIVGSFLRVDGTGRFCLIFDFYTKQGIADFKKDDPTRLFELFKAQIFTFIRQELFRIFKQENPLIARLRRKFNNYIKSSEFITRPIDENNPEFIIHKRFRSLARHEKSLIRYEDLYQLAEHCHNASIKYRDWLEIILIELNDMQGVRNYVKVKDLIRAMINVRLRYLELFDDREIQGFTPLHSYIENKINSALERTMTLLRENDLNSFILKGKISYNDAESIASGLQKYLIDYYYTGTDSIPTYFRETMPKAYHKQYLSNFKHIFESCIKKGIARMDDELK